MVRGPKGQWSGWEDRKPGLGTEEGCAPAGSEEMVWGPVGWDPRRLQRCLGLPVQGKAGERFGEIFLSGQMHWL